MEKPIFIPVTQIIREEKDETKFKRVPNFVNLVYVQRIAITGEDLGTNKQSQKVLTVEIEFGMDRVADKKGEAIDSFMEIAVSKENLIEMLQATGTLHSFKP